MDFQFALRSLRKNAAFTILAVLILGLGIGANTAIFSVVNGILLRPLPYHQAERIVAVSTLWKKSGHHGTISAPDFNDWHDQSTVFESLAYYAAGENSVSVGKNTEYAGSALVSPEFFRVMGSEPIIGRTFAKDSYREALIGYSFWKRQFAGNPKAIGQTVRFDGKIYTVVGIAPDGFRFPEQTDVWAPADPAEETKSRTAHNYVGIGRLKSGVTVAEAQTQMTTIGSRLEAQYPENKNKGISVISMKDEMTGDVRRTLFLLLGAVAVVLLIACANVANLLLAKATSRTREMAIRAAIGASRGRLIRQLISESLVLAILSGIVGVFIAVWGVDALLAVAPHDLPRLAEVNVDASVLAFTLGLSLLSSILFGLAPAWQASRIDLNESLKQGGTRTVIGGGAGKIRAALVIGEVALSVVLVAGAGLLIRSFVALNQVDRGFRSEKLLVLETAVGSADLEAAKRATTFYRDLLPRLASVPGVSAVAGTNALPSGDVHSNGAYILEGQPMNEATFSAAPQALFTVITPDYFAALGIPIRHGRDFNPGDQYDAPFVAIVNESLARRTFSNEDPIGKKILCGLDSPNAMTIVGVVKDIRSDSPSRAPAPELFMPYRQHPFPATAMRLLVKTSAEPATLAETMRRKIRELNPDVPVKWSTMEMKLSDSVATPRFRTILLGSFALLALGLAMAGVYGIMSYMVSQRSAEIGLRMALGATPGDVLALVLSYGMKLVGIGLVLGMAGAIAATRLLQSVLYEVKPTDPLTYAGVALVLAASALVASYIPAARATRVDPLDALRTE